VKLRLLFADEIAVALCGWFSAGAQRGSCWERRVFAADGRLCTFVNIIGRAYRGVRRLLQGSSCTAALGCCVGQQKTQEADWFSDFQVFDSPCHSGTWDTRASRLRSLAFTAIPV